MKGFKHTGNGPTAGHSFTTRHGFSGSATPMRRAVGGVIDAHKQTDHAATPRGKPFITQELSEHGGRGDLTSGFKKGGKAGKRVVEFKSGGRVVRFACGGKVTRPQFAKGGHVQEHDGPRSESKGGGDYARGGRPAGFKKGGKNWIKPAIKRPGALHQATHTPKGEKIPEAKIRKAEHSRNPRIRREAHMGETLKHMHHGKG